MESSIFVEKIAGNINRLGLTTPAILLLEAHKPLAFIGSQLLLIAQPTLELITPPNLVKNTAGVLSDSTQVEQLIRLLEQHAAAPPAGKEAS
ncbi:MAG: hypothetical protein Kow0031_34230 [Anaerolineae bacterium]